MNKTFIPIVKLWITILILVKLATIARGQNPEGQLLTLDQAKSIAIENTPSLKIAKQKMEQSKAKQERSRAGFYPNVETKIGSEQGLSGSSEQAFTFGYMLGRWNIYRGGSDLSLSQAASLESQKAELEFQKEKLRIETYVEELFSNLLYFRDLTAIKKRFIDINSQQQAFAKQLVARGGGAQSDVLEFDLRAKILSSDLVEMERNYQENLIRLKTYIGDALGQNATPTGELPHRHIKGTLADFVNTKLTDTPQIRVSALELEIADKNLQASRGRWQPQLDLEGRIGALPLSDGGEKGKVGSTVAVVATWELFGGFDTMHENKERIAEKSKADWQLKEDIYQIMAESEIHFNELVFIQKRADLEKDNIRTAKRYYELVFEDFKRGYKNSTDFSGAAEKWYDAEVQRKFLDIEFIRKKLALENKLGRTIPTVSMKDVDAHEDQTK